MSDQKLISELEHYRDLTRLGPGLIYRMGYDFVLQHGKSYPITPYPKDGWRGLPKQCFGNAIILAATKGYQYVEGYVLSPVEAGSLAIHHGWNVDQDGTLLDSTWQNTGSAYMGVEFSVERADDATWNGDSTVLDDYQRRWPLFRTPWKGEDYSIVWPDTSRIDLLRDVAKGKVSYDECYEKIAAQLYIGGYGHSDLSRNL